jgi:hypothetical protein
VTQTHVPGAASTEDSEDHYRGRWGYSWPQHYPYYPSGAAHTDRTLYDFARHNSAEAAVSKAIEMAERMHERSLEQIEAARKGGPDSFIAKFLEAQEEKWERLRQEERDRWERQQSEAREAHRRELERIKAETEARLAEQRAAAEEREKRIEAERKYLLELEEKRLSILRQEAEIQQKRLEAEMARTREEMRLLQERTAQELRDSRETVRQTIEANQQELEKRLEREREILDREHDLRQKAMEREHELQKQHLDMERQLIERQAGDQLFTTINTVIKEFSKGLEKVVDLKKLEAMTPEAQAAAVARGSVDGNVIGPPPPVGVTSPAAASAPSVSQAPSGAGSQASSSNGETLASPSSRRALGASATSDGASAPSSFQQEIEANIREALQKPMFRAVIREWSAHVDAQNDPTMFANIFLEFMRDPIRHEVRQGCAVFAGFMSIRPWPKMLEFLRPHLDPDVLAIFERPEAADFYEAFRAMVAYQVREYWQQCLAAARADEEQKRRSLSAAPQAQQQQQPSQGRTPVESSAFVSAESQPEQSQESPVVPQREDQGRQAS